MKEKEINFSDYQIDCLTFEKILFDLGIQKKEYCEWRGKCRSWFYEVLRKRRYLNILDMKALLYSTNSSVSAHEFIALCEKYGVKANEDGTEKIMEV